MRFIYSSLVDLDGVLISDVAISFDALRHDALRKMT